MSDVTGISFNQSLTVAALIKYEATKTNPYVSPQAIKKKSLQVSLRRSAETEIEKGTKVADCRHDQEMKEVSR